MFGELNHIALNNFNLHDELQLVGCFSEYGSLKGTE